MSSERMAPVLAFDIETVPDTDGGRRLHGLDGLSDEDVARAMTQLRVQQTGREFLAHHLHRVCAISVALWRGDDFKVWSLGEPGSAEAELIGRFFEGVQRFRPVLVSWNGSGFDLPVLHYRALLHGVAAPRYWETGGSDTSFRWNNYQNRFHERHTDLMDVLSGYQGRAAAPLDEVAVLMGLPGKMGLHGSQVWDAYAAGELEQIRHYCDADVLNTFLIYLRFQLMRGQLDERGLVAAEASVRAFLDASGQAHLREFSEAWQGAKPQ